MLERRVYVRVTCDDAIWMTRSGESVGATTTQRTSETESRTPASAHDHSHDHQDAMNSRERIIPNQMKETLLLNETVRTNMRQGVNL